MPENASTYELDQHLYHEERKNVDKDSNYQDQYTIGPNMFDK